MSSQQSPEWLATTVGAVRELMIKRLEAASLDPEAKREIEMSLEELDMMQEELQGQAAFLVREKQRYAEFFRFAPDGYVITDAGGTIREANEAALELLKAPGDAVLGRALSSYIAEEDRVAFLTRALGVTLGRSAQPLTWQVKLQPAEGAALATEFSVRAIALKQSGVGGFCWLIRPAR
jgi:PAS domain S-box-containing protein